MSKTPLRIGFIGLSSSPGGRPWANISHLPALLSLSSRYTIAAITGRTLESALATRDFHQLPKSTKLYSSPQELAQDPEIDLVVVSTNVATHYDIVKPILEAGRNTYVEWPLASNLAQAKELVELAERKGVRTIIGLQGRMNPLVEKIRAIVRSGEIGKVLSTTLTASTSVLPQGNVPESIRYFTDAKSGGSLASIFLVHTIDQFQAALGKIESFSSVLANTRGEAKIRGSSETIPQNTADTILVQGFITSQIPFQFFIRGEAPFDSGEAFRWSILGTRGEILVTSDSASLALGIEIKVQVKTTENGESNVREEVTEKEGAGPNIARVYEGYALGKVGDGDSLVPDFGVALKAHQFLEEVYAGKLGERFIQAERR